MYKPTYISYECMVDFRKPAQESINGLAATLASRYPNTEEDAPKSILLRHVSTFPLSSGKVHVDLTLWKDRFGMRIGVGRHEEVGDENESLSPVPSASVSDALGTFVDIWAQVAQLPIDEASFMFFAALDQDDRQARPRLGEALFSLTARPFGAKYDTALLFKWRASDPLPGTVVAQVLPISPNGDHVHYTATYVLDDKDLLNDPEAKWTLTVRDFFSLAVESTPDLVHDVLGGGPNAASRSST